MLSFQKIPRLDLKKLLPLFSYLFHPVFIPLAGTLLYLAFVDTYFTLAQCYLLVFQVVIITFFLPLSFFYLLRTFGKVDNIMLSDLNQRKIPLVMQMALTSVLITQSITQERFEELFFFFLSGLVSTFLAFVLLFARVKSSIHMIGASAITFFLIGLSLRHQINSIDLLALCLFSTGLIAASRLQMRAHTLTELAVGYLVGLLPQVGLWFFWL